MQFYPPKESARGFTLIELLVVVAIIVILITVLLPSLSMARKQANRVGCLSILRQLQLASDIYANEYDNYYVPVRMDVNGSGVLWSSNGAYRDILKIQKTGGSMVVPRSLICREASYALSHPAANDRFSLSETYGINVNSLTLDIGGVIVPFIGYKRTTLLAPQQKLAIADGVDWWIRSSGSGKYIGETGNQSQNYNFAIAYRHEDAVAVAFFDSHAEMMKRSRVDATKMSASAAAQLWDPLAGN